MFWFFLSFVLCFDCTNFECLSSIYKSFDTINHEIFLRKAASFRFSNQSIMSFQPHLLNRGFHVNMKNKYSRTVKIYSEVVQGSILGPLLFLLIYEWYEAGCRLWLVSKCRWLCFVYQHKDVNKIRQSLT